MIDSIVRVLHVLPHRGGGAETYIDMLERLSGFSHERFPLSSGRTPASALSSLPVRWPLFVTRARTADLVHCHGDVASVIALPVLRRRPAVITTHGLHMLRRVEGLGRRPFQRAAAAAVAAAREVICTSASEREDLLLLVAPADPGKLTLVVNGIDLPEPTTAGGRASARQALGVAPDEVLGLFVGQLEPRKQPLLAAAAAIEARAQGAPFALAVAGDGPLAPALQALAGDAVKPLGHREDLDRLLQAADVFVQTSEREGMSLALLDAMGHGLPIVASDGPGNPEAVGDAAILVPTGDQPALVEALLRLSGDEPLRTALGDRARSRAETCFGAERFLEATEAVYRRVTAPAPGADGASA